MNKNNNCDGSTCREASGEVRRLPTGGDGAVIVCEACYQHEIQYRAERNKDLEPSCKFPLPAWSELEVYLPAQTATAAQPVNALRYKLYRCKECGHEQQIQTNHYGECYSFGNVNTCPKCPPYKRPNTWLCAEPVPAGGWVPEPWTKATITVRKVKGGVK